VLSLGVTIVSLTFARLSIWNYLRRGRSLSTPLAIHVSPDFHNHIAVNLDVPVDCHHPQRIHQHSHIHLHVNTH